MKVIYPGEYSSVHINESRGEMILERLYSLHFFINKILPRLPVSHGVEKHGQFSFLKVRAETSRSFIAFPLKYCIRQRSDVILWKFGNSNVFAYKVSKEGLWKG